MRGKILAACHFSMPDARGEVRCRFATFCAPPRDPRPARGVPWCSDDVAEMSGFGRDCSAARQRMTS